MGEFKRSVGKLVERISNARLKETKSLHCQGEIPVVVRQICHTPRTIQLISAVITGTVMGSCHSCVSATVPTAAQCYSDHRRNGQCCPSLRGTVRQACGFWRRCLSTCRIYYQ